MGANIAKSRYSLQKPLSNVSIRSTRSLYIDLCNCLILICSIQHQMKVKLWTTNNCRLWLTNWPKISKPLKISVSSIACSRKSVLRLLVMHQLLLVITDQPRSCFLLLTYHFGSAKQLLTIRG